VQEFVTDRQATDDYIVRSLRIACWIIKNIDTHSEFTIRTGFPLQQLLGEHGSM